MIDLQDLRERPDAYADAAKKKRINVDVKNFLKVDQGRRELTLAVDDMRAKRNAVSKQIPTMKGAEKEAAVKEMKELGDTLKKKEEELGKIEEEWTQTQLLLPSIPLESVPEGKDDTENVELRTWGKKPSFDFDAKDHIALGEALNIIDIARGVKIAGARSYFLKGDGARLELAVLMFTLDHLAKKGYTPFIPPLLANYDAMMGTSYFPGGEEQAYAVGVQKEKDGQMESDGVWLIGTSEVSVASYHQGETLKITDLPKRYCGISNCFRREAGTYGKDAKGLYRIHQFQKVEQVVLCEADADVSAKMHQELLTNAEEVLQALKLPYRVVAVCTGDMGRGQVYKNDIETWMPSRKGYGETHSCSTFYDFQARRLGIKYEDKDGKKKFVHTLNNTCIASPRILIPLLEIYQNEDGSVNIPDVLQPYIGGKKKITK
ncbi:serine--tRNA ligase [Candidatus Peribacteria bacterium RIFCSPHIGHO2_02_FULL_52_16]|nr:MAG: serine--tRNA ligase [Candidatus Peribacteria bacterium RIFCSPHIGHO2_01_FULL_51_35]OGJ61532.1 MAG: serine--tRNA ligase [Candidatus Peribacteria bacterium RIFCSPHIGHO2_02_FULL_52_16]